MDCVSIISRRLLQALRTAYLQLLTDADPDVRSMQCVYSDDTWHTTLDAPRTAGNPMTSSALGPLARVWRLNWSSTSPSQVLVRARMQLPNWARHSGVSRKRIGGIRELPCVTALQPPHLHAFSGAKPSFPHANSRGRVTTIMYVVDDLDCTQE